MIDPRFFETLNYVTGHNESEDEQCWCNPQVVHVSADGNVVKVHQYPGDVPPDDVILRAIASAEYDMYFIPYKELN